ncbi:MAG TPA: class I SAM-dependent methyltransferase [Gaiellaceae bacterium]|jgi:SAM-dependent methyltransferase
MTPGEKQPQTWHHGIVARWWAEFNVDGPEIHYFQKFIEDDGQPALDLACGTGRLLVPYLRAGLDVDGCDISSDMLALCRERAEAEGLSPNLFQQAMHELRLPRRYRTIVVCGGFGLGGNREQSFAGLERIYDHLEPGGLLLLDNEVPYANAGLWRRWLEEERRELPTPLPELGEGDRRRASDGAEYELRSRIVELDPLAQSVTLEMRADMWRDGEHVAEEEHVLKMSLYFTQELTALLESTGFSDVTLRGDYTEEKPDGDTEFVVFSARKPAQV